MARATRADVARTAGVSPATVSVVLNGQASRMKISPETQERVRAAADQLRYIPSAAGRLLRTQRCPAIALLLDERADEQLSPLVSLVTFSALRHARRHGYFVIPITADQAALGGLVESMLSQILLCGAICDTSSGLAELGRTLAANDLSVMWTSLLGDEDQPAGCGHVRLDPAAGITDLVEGLDLPAEPRVLAVRGPAIFSDHLADAARLIGPGWQRLTLAHWSTFHAERVIGEALTQADPPDVVWCTGPQIAAGALRACQQAGLDVPGDIQVVTDGDQTVPAAQDSPVTALHWPIRALAEHAVDGLLAHANDESEGKGEGATVMLRTHVSWRSTTRQRSGGATAR